MVCTGRKLVVFQSHKIPVQQDQIHRQASLKKWIAFWGYFAVVWLLLTHSESTGNPLNIFHFIALVDIPVCVWLLFLLYVWECMCGYVCVCVYVCMCGLFIFNLQFFQASGPLCLLFVISNCRVIFKVHTAFLHLMFLQV